jgi:hypothetical protein
MAETAVVRMSKDEQGLPGQPGQTGQEGVGGGGRGGTGGAGGAGGVVHERRLIALIVFVTIVAIGLSTATYLQSRDIKQNTDRLNRTAATLIVHNREIDKLNAAQGAETYAGCQRTNILRARVNGNSGTVFEALRILKNHLLEDLQDLSATKSAIRQTDLAALGKEINSLEYQPLVDCKAALAHPYTYLPPATIPFWKVRNP